MKIIKKFLISLGVFIVFLLVIAIFIKKDYAVQREVVIDKPLGEVFDFIILLKNQDSFSKWAMADPEMKKSYKGTDGVVGFISAWESETDSIGAGEQEIIKIAAGERIDYELRFKEPIEITDNAFLSTQSIDSNHTKVVWGFEGKMNYPMNLTLIFMNFDQILGGDLELGLNNLKTYLEKRP